MTDFLIQRLWSESPFLVTILAIGVAWFAYEKIQKRFFLKRKVQKVVANANKDAAKAFDPDFEQAPVDLHSIRGLNYSFYEEVTREMAALGFKAGNDLENLTLSAQYPWMRTAERPFFGKDGAIVAHCFHLKTRGWRRILAEMAGNIKVDVYTVGFGTDLEDGAVVGTGSSNMGSVFSRPADCYTIELPRSTPMAAMLDTHIEHVRRVMEERKVQAWKPIRNESEFNASQKLYSEKLAAHREQQGAVSVEEFEKLTRNLDSETRQLVLDEAGKFKDQEKKQPQWETV